MGTNYYHRTDICDSCDRYNERHIGKDSAGWQFGFQGYEADEDGGKEIKSWEDWYLELTRLDGKIFDENGQEYGFKGFCELVEYTLNGKFHGKPNKNHYDYCVEEGHNIDTDWKDEEGYAFTLADFS